MKRVGWGPMPEVAPVPFDPADPKAKEWWAGIEFSDPVTRRDWTVQMRFFLREGRVECGELRLADRDGRGVSGQDMRAFPWGSLISDMRADFQEQQFHTLGANPGLPNFTERGASEGKLVEVAAVYRRAALAGNPTKEVMDLYRVSRSTASRWIKMARDAGHLGAAVPGKGGEATTEDNNT